MSERIPQHALTPPEAAVAIVAILLHAVIVVAPLVFFGVVIWRLMR